MAKTVLQSGERDFLLASTATCWQRSAKPRSSRWICATQASAGSIPSLPALEGGAEFPGLCLNLEEIWAGGVRRGGVGYQCSANRLLRARRQALPERYDSNQNGRTSNPHKEQDMGKVFEAIVEKDGRIKLTSPLELKRGCRVLVTIPSENEDAALNGLLLSQQSLQADWLIPEEDEAWSHL